MDAFVGTWRHKKVEEGGMDALLDALKATDDQREQYKQRQYETTIMKGDTDKKLKISLKDLGDGRTTSYEIELNEVTEHLDIDGQLRKKITTWDGKNLREQYINTEDDFFNIRTFNERGNMTTTLSLNGATCVYEWIRC